jgi:hypothetical protein
MSQLSQQCPERLYRMMWQTPDGIVDAFALSATREEARRFFYGMALMSLAGPRSRFF